MCLLAGRGAVHRQLSGEAAKRKVRCAGMPAAIVTSHIGWKQKLQVGEDRSQRLFGHVQPAALQTLLLLLLLPLLLLLSGVMLQNGLS
jgi:hypothetical protein